MRVITTDALKAAVMATAHVYIMNGLQHAKAGRGELAMTEFSRAQLLARLHEDDNLVEMLAGRIHEADRTVN